MVLGKSLRTPVSCPAEIILCMALPNTTTDLPSEIPASANVLTLAIFDAKVVATTKPCEFLISFLIGDFTVSSDRPERRLNTFVESHINAFTSPNDDQSSLLNGSPTPGVSSNLKSPE